MLTLDILGRTCKHYGALVVFTLSCYTNLRLLIYILTFWVRKNLGF